MTEVRVIGRMAHARCGIGSCLHSSPPGGHIPEPDVTRTPDHARIRPFNIASCHTLAKIPGVSGKFQRLHHADTRRGITPGGGHPFLRATGAEGYARATSGDVTEVH